LRFSKIFGVGRQSSLPKTWKGTRKRRKNKSNNENDANAANTSTAHAAADDKFQRQRFESQISNDVFKLFDSDFTASGQQAAKLPAALSENEEQMKETEEARLQVEKKAAEVAVGVEDELEFETDDEVINPS
jgi:hypothetical protein